MLFHDFHESTVLALRSNSRAKAEVPPNLLMMSSEVIAAEYTDIRKDCNRRIPVCVIYAPEGISQSKGVLTTVELLARLRERKVKNAEIARALNLSASRVTELFDGTRALKLDEAAKLAEAFSLEDGRLSSQRVSPVPAPVARLIVEHVALELGVRLQGNEQKIDELSEDVRAFAEFVTDPKVRESIDLAVAFFQAMRLRRPAPEEVS